MAVSSVVDPAQTAEPPVSASAPDPLGFLAGRHYTCYCGKSVVGTMLCQDCAEEMVERLRRFVRVDRAPFTKIG